MDFLSLILFLVIYYIRPHEWIHALAILQPVKLVMAYAIIAMFARKGGVSLRDMFRTPHDWMMLLYMLWINVTSSAVVSTVVGSYSLYVFYLVTVQALSSTERIERFLKWWAIMILAVAGLAVASEYGFDPMGSYDITHNAMKDRLVLNTSIFDNPNALGHSIVPVVMMIYFLMIWKRPVFSRIASIPVLALPLYCLYLTVSKGSFLSCFATMVAGLTFGRSRKVQLIVLLVALTAGWAGVTQLPRMEELNKARTDQAIQGRVLAFTFGLEMMKTKFAGVGYEHSAISFFQANGFWLASHSSYVQIGCELGWTGLFLFLGVLYCNLRVLLTAQTTTVEEERVRRVLFILVCSYIISSWMVNFTYRTTFFLMAAVVAAFHRQLLKKNQPEEKPARGWVRVNTARPAPVVGGNLQPAFATGTALPVAIRQSAIVPQATTTLAAGGGANAPLAPAAPDQFIEATVMPPPFLWNRIGLLDLVIILAMTLAAARFWQYVMHYM